ncbi:MAG: hypothetical protein RBT34_09535 [Anaerolineaceae bacterium]|jgi:hypothetical protein|nr:hypothetical protein [Anaerolineaceae bacterium]
MSKTRTIVLALFIFILSTACLSLGGLGEKVINQAIEKADLPEGMLETSQAGLEIVSTQVAAAAEATADDAPATDANSSNPIPANLPYPVPDDAKDILYANEMLGFTTSLNPEEVLAFYQQALSAQGFTERSGSKLVGENNAQIFFDGHPSGNPLMISASNMVEFTYVGLLLADN